MIDGMDALTACYRFAGAIGISVDSRDLRELWQMHYGKECLIRKQVVWQSGVIFSEKLDVETFLRTGYFTKSASNKVRMSDEQRLRVEITQGCMNRNLPLPDFDSPTWEDDAYAAFENHDKAKQ